jgi:hypothetical protein
MSDDRAFFRLCSSCKRELIFGGRYYTCSVSTCNRAKDPLTFCSLPCFEAHVPVVRHREAWAEEQKAPSREQWLAQEQQERAKAAEAEARAAAPRAERRIIGQEARQEPRAPGPVELSDEVPKDILIVVSKLKAYIRARSGMNTSDGAMDVLSDIVREVADKAIQKAAAEGRKTVLDRDF